MYQAGAGPLQGGVRRSLIRRWSFVDPDRYRSALLEAVGPDTLVPLVDLEYTRVDAPAAAPSAPVGEAPAVPKRLEPATLLLAGWRNEGVPSGEWTFGGALGIEAAFEWVPYANGILGRVLASRGGGEPVHVLDVYLYHHTGLGELRCLALSGGGVYAGRVSVMPGGGLEADLEGFEGERSVPIVVRLEPGGDGTRQLHVRIVSGAERLLMFEALCRAIPPTELPDRGRSPQDGR
jgi:hypothetical protein